MKLSTNKYPRKAGFVSYVLVLSTGTILLLMMVFAYKQAMADSQVQGKVQLRSDYSEKEEAIVRAIVSITPNKAIRVMQADANTTEDQKNDLKWSQIFRESIVKAGITNKSAGNGITSGNVGNGDLENQVADIFSDVVQRVPGNGGAVGLVTSGVNIVASTLQGTGYPDSLTSDAVTKTADQIYPIISGSKENTIVSINDQRNGYSLMNYPNISFAYASPGDKFLAKRNWWAFSVDTSNPNRTTTKLNSPKRKFALSIYEIPSQLAISASTKLALGAYRGNGADGTGGANWDTEKVRVEGNVYAGKANLEGNLGLTRLAVKEQINFGGSSTVGGNSYQTNDPFKAGVREAAWLNNKQALAVSKASESGRCNFISFNPGESFFNRHVLQTAANEEPPNPINNNRQTWGKYVIGAKQCAMWLDVLDIENATPNPADPIYNSPLSSRPTLLRLTYRLDGNINNTHYIDFDYRNIGGAQLVLSTLPPGYRLVASENQIYSTPTVMGVPTVMDCAFGAPGNGGGNGTPTTGFSFNDFIIKTTFAKNIDNWGNPNPIASTSAGYARPGNPFRIKSIKTEATGVAGVNNIAWGIEFQPNKLRAFLASFGLTHPMFAAADIDINNSLAVNIDSKSINDSYLTMNPGGLNDPNRFKVNLKDNAPLVMQYGLILKGCSDLRDFTRGFSLVTDMRLFVGDNFNAEKSPPPTGYEAGKDYFVPCSLFAPQKRYGFDADATNVDLTGQLGSLADDRGSKVGDTFESVRLLDSKAVSYNANDVLNPTKGILTPSQIKVNLKPITNINEVPPIMMKNWLITAEEIRN
jgi:hypothetical protein